MMRAEEGRPFVTLTRGGEGFDRRSFAVDDIFKMIRAGILSDEENFELYEGEIVPSSPEGQKHILIKSRLARFFFSTLGREYLVAPDSTLYLSAATFIEPDLHIYLEADKDAVPLGPKVLLVAEISLLTLERDLKTKARLCAAHGIGEYWVIDPEARIIHVHRQPASSGYGSITRHGPDEALTPERLAGLVFRYLDVFEA